MPRDHVVRQGECIASIAERYGFVADTLWNDPKNAELKRLREDPDVLQKGDVLHVPDRTKGGEAAAAGSKHTFKRKGLPRKLKLRFLSIGEPRADEAVLLNIDGERSETTTDGDGWIEVPVPPRARNAEVVFTSDGSVHNFLLGHLDPVDTVRGQKMRLDNLGFSPGEIDDTADGALAQALRAFQDDHDLEPTGEADAGTLDKLAEIAGS